MTMRSLRLAGAAMAVLSFASGAGAQPAPPPDGIAVGDFWFRPRLELRLRGEYYHHPVTAFGDAPVFATDVGVPIDTAHQWVVQERARIGLAVEKGPLAANVVVQDGRIAGFPSAAAPLAEVTVATTSFHVAYVEAHSPDSHPSFARVGRQEVQWGDGRLVGISDWRLAPRSLDAALGRIVLRQVDFDGLAAILAPPSAVTPEESSQAPTGLVQDSGTGAQLYAVGATLHVDPLLHAQVSGLGRIVRSPYPPALTPSDTFVIDARAFGDRAGLAYAAELAYEFGRLAVVRGIRDVRAWAATAHVDWQTGLPFRARFSLSGSYATGGDGSAGGAINRFDPILPDARAGLGQMGVYAWSNVADTAVTTSLVPLDDVTLALGYRYVRLADPRGAWFAASLLPIGQDRQNDAPFLGHEIDALVSYAPYDGLVVSGGYGAFVTGEGARAILSGRADGGPRLLSAAFLQVSLAAP
jgi:Alginate export